jgi:D-alanyl-D-alanine carboxypeptidase/D-alanyl-D-alanine-endopeptidase (penicillin-binding protein 4)
VDGSGLSRSNQASPKAVARLLDRARGRAWFDDFHDSLAVAGRSGTLRDRMRDGAARGRCRAKTGTLRDVSALSGYCTSRSRDRIVFSILMNRVNPSSARRLQDRMANAMARYRG